jgi:type II secretory pathway pseudopilin PulG
MNVPIHLTRGSLGCRRADRSPARQNGFSLFESLASLTIAILLYGVIATFAQGFMRWDRVIVRRISDIEQWRRLSEDLRLDVRRAREVLLTNNQQLLILMPDSAQIRYELSLHGCSRTRAARDGSVLARERYALSNTQFWSLDVDRTGRLPLFSATLHLSANAGAGVPRSNHILAAMGADLDTRHRGAHQ